MTILRHLHKCPKVKTNFVTCPKLGHGREHDLGLRFVLRWSQDMSQSEDTFENTAPGLQDAGILENIVMPCRKKEKSNEWSKRVGIGMPFIIGDSNCRGSVRITLENGQ